MSLTSPTAQWTTYLDLELDVKPYLQFPVSGAQNIVQDQTMQLILDSACWWVQDYLGRPIGPTEFFRRFDGWAGWNGAYIMLPYYPVLEVVRIAEYWGLSGPHVLLEQTPQHQYGVGATGQSSDTYQIDPVDGRLTRTFPGLVQRPFFPGSRNIEVTWIAGFNPVPPDVKLATLELFAWWYRNTQEDPRMAGGHGAYGMGGSDKNELWPAVPNRVTVMLEAYTQQGLA